MIEAGFAITASWPVNTGAGGSLHIRDKTAANSTVFLVCRPQAVADPDAGAVYWPKFNKIAGHLPTLGRILEVSSL